MYRQEKHPCNTSGILTRARDWEASPEGGVVQYWQNYNNIIRLGDSVTMTHLTESNTNSNV